MDEIIKILIQVGIILLIFFIPIPKFNYFNFSKEKSFSFFDEIFFNLIILINLILILSFFNLNIFFMLIITSLLVLFYLIYNFKKNELKFDLRIIFLLIFFLIIAFDVSFNLKLGWDAQKLWFPKVLNFYQNNNLSNLNTLYWPEYPYLGSLLWAFFWKISFSEYEYLGRFIYIFIFCLSVFSLSDILKVSLIKQVLFSSISITLIYNYHLFSGYQEILIFSFVIFAAKYSYLIIHEKKLNFFYLVLLSLIFNALIWIKNEGIFISLFISIIIFFFSNFKLNHKLILLSILGLLIVIRLSVFNFYNFDISLQPGSYTDFSLKNFINKFDSSRILIIYKYLFQSLFKNFNYLILLSPLFIFFYYLRSKKFGEIKFIIIYLILHLGFINFAFLMTDRPIEFAVISSVDRLIFEFSGYYFLLIIMCLNKYIENKK